MVINVIATVRQGSFEKEVPVEAPALAKISDARKEGEKTPLVRKNAVILFCFISNCFSNWWYGRNYPYINCKR